MWVVYILRSLKDGKYYVGSTSDLGDRLKRHNAGGTPSTRHRRPLEIVYSEECRTRGEAVSREFKIKSYKGGEAFKKLVS
ncbi:MAG: GIY-YIG nuclease family protein [Patescibacteria group bacterium]